jgi:NAD(P)-dependent dehydrogenase (short-subunit alcohol dehydrogenase family)
MKVLIFGGAGGLALAFARFRPHGLCDPLLLGRGQCDVRDFMQVMEAVDRHRPDFIVNCAGVSDMRLGVSTQEVIDTNLKGAIYVANVASSFGTPALLIGSTAGMQDPAQHPVYGPAKAGVISHVAVAAKRGQQVYCLSPNRMDTPMREADWPGEDPRTRLMPGSEVVPIMVDIMDGKYAPGANVVVRKVGISGRVDVFQAPTVVMAGLL